MYLLSATCSYVSLTTCHRPQHFDGYTLDKSPPRLSFDPTVGIWDLRQTYFPAFQAAIQEAKVSSIMCRSAAITRPV